MSQRTKRIQVFIVSVLTLLVCGTASAQDDGARTSWKALDGTNIIAFQHLSFDGDSFGSKVFDPVHYIYPESQFQANLFMLTYVRNFTLFDRTAVFGATVLGGNLDVESFGSPLTGGVDFKQAAHGFGDPSAQLAVNVFGAPAIRSFYDISKYEPKAVLDVAVLGSFPIGQYDSDRVVNMSLNRWWTRIAAPFTYHIGPFVPGLPDVGRIHAVGLFVRLERRLRGSQTRQRPALSARGPCNPGLHLQVFRLGRLSLSARDAVGDRRHRGRREAQFTVGGLHAGLPRERQRRNTCLLSRSRRRWLGHRGGHVSPQRQLRVERTCREDWQAGRTLARMSFEMNP